MYYNYINLLHVAIGLLLIFYSILKINKPLNKKELFHFNLVLFIIGIVLILFHSYRLATLPYYAAWVNYMHIVIGAILLILVYGLHYGIITIGNNFWVASISIALAMIVYHAYLLYQRYERMQQLSES